jgi:predicted transcriptional regulator
MPEPATQLDFEIITEIVSAYVSNNPLPAAELPALIASVAAAVGELLKDATAERPKPAQPAVPVKNSVKPDYIVCLEDGKKFKTLKRHLMSHHGLTPDEYRAKWKLPSDYPLVAPNYTAARSALAKKMGLGRERGQRGRRPKGRREAP